ncbi:hypothetical protein [Elizabethkingia anophelis]|uniref:hypothetical protein n=1 Tax=Elizabethkingia anophelis TaxID=1117645 RepID=UPI002012F727|nr:hypothetical protein [Elizabethkingia anophelis]EJC8059054.1 hypothetical protein [Elizabethkingia anophelis]MCL1640175.1 hypothetical protein [Elizabethkingia anophelis]MCL1645407.1 hypothetical protein [Elizabethkingia anophelis]MCT3925338.1 hypothetical protein [Elizabethkingia anophelis]MCT4034647.1 hypothetical protein [Elizabethkingia anophelis]
MKKIKFKKQDSIITELLTREQLRSILAGSVGSGSGSKGCSSSICRQHSDCSSGIEDIGNPTGYCRTCVVYNTVLGYGFCGGSPI